MSQLAIMQVTIGHVQNPVSGGEEKTLNNPPCLNRQILTSASQTRTKKDTIVKHTQLNTFNLYALFIREIKFRVLNCISAGETSVLFSLTEYKSSSGLPCWQLVLRLVRIIIIDQCA